MPVTVTLRPNTTSAGPGWTNQGGAASIHAALADANDATYAENLTDLGSLLNLGLDETPLAGMPSTARITGVQILVRAYKTGAYSSLRARTRIAVGAGTRSDTAHPDDWITQPSVQAHTGIVRARSPLNRFWTVADIASLSIDLYSNAPDTGNPVAKVTRLDVRVTYVRIPTVTVTGPSGTQTTTRPTVSWVTAHEDGLAQSQVQVRIFDAATYNDPTFNPGVSRARHQVDLTGAAGSYTVQPAGISNTGGEGVLSGGGVPTGDVDLPQGSYRAYVRSAVIVSGEALWSAWASSDFAVSLDAASTPIVVARPEPDLGRIALEVQGTENLLTKDDADLEGTTGRWFGALTNATVAVGAASEHGSGSLRLTAASAGDMAALLSYTLAVVPDATIGFYGRVKAATTGRSTRMSLVFYNDAGTQIGPQVDGSLVVDSSGAFATVAVFAKVPDGATQAAPVIFVAAPANAEQHYFDVLKVAPGLSAWSRGGFAPRNLLRANTASVETDASGWASRSNCTIAQVGTTALDGSKSLRLTATGTPNMGANTIDRVACIPGREYTALVAFRAVATARTCRAGILWFDSAGGLLGTNVGAAATDSTSGWTQANVTHTAPPGAAFMDVGAFVYGVAGSEQHYVDCASIAADRLLAWQPGGTQVAQRISLEYTDDPIVVDDLGVPLDPDGLTATWLPVRGATNLEPDRQQKVYAYDYEAPPALRRYRARSTILEEGVAIASPNSQTVLATLNTGGDDTWWFKCPNDPDLNWTSPHVAEASSEIIERVEFQEPLDEDHAVATTTGMLGDDGQYTIDVIGAADWARAEAWLRTPRTMQVVSPFGTCRYLRVDRRSVHVTNSDPGPTRTITFTYREVDRPEG
jgi:hypothetical protein